MDILTKDLKVMDAAAISLARENNIPVVVFNVREAGNFKQVALGWGNPPSLHRNKRGEYSKLIQSGEIYIQACYRSWMLACASMTRDELSVRRLLQRVNALIDV